MKKYRHLRGTLFDIERELRTRHTGADEAISEAFARDSIRSVDSSSTVKDLQLDAEVQQRNERIGGERRPRVAIDSQQQHIVNNFIDSVKNVILEARFTKEETQKFANLDLEQLVQQAKDSNNMFIETLRNVVNFNIGNIPGFYNSPDTMKLDIEKAEKRSLIFQKIKMINLVSIKILHTFLGGDTSSQTWLQVCAKLNEVYKKLIPTVTERTVASKIHTHLFSKGGSSFITPFVMGKFIMGYGHWGRPNDYNFVGSSIQAENTLSFMKDPTLFIKNFYDSQENKFVENYLNGVAIDKRAEINTFIRNNENNVYESLLPIMILEHRLGANGAWITGGFGDKVKNTDDSTFKLYRISISKDAIDSKISLPPPTAASAFPAQWIPGGFTTGGCAEIALRDYSFDDLTKSIDENKLQIFKYTFRNGKILQEGQEDYTNEFKDDMKRPEVERKNDNETKKWY